MGSELRIVYLVDDNSTNLVIGRTTLIGKYNVITIPSGQKLLKMLEKAIPDIILLDVEMPEMSGFDVIKILKKTPTFAEVPVIFLAAKSDPASELEGLSLGAIDYITKPFSPPLLLKRIEVHLLIEEQRRALQDYNDTLMSMVAEKTQTVVTLQNAILKTVAELVEFRDNITGTHIERTQNYLRVLTAKALELGVYKNEIEKWDMEIFLQSAQLHDVGKISIKDTADVYDALISSHPYKTAFSHEQAMEIMLTGKGSHFDPKLIDVYALVTDEFKAIAKV